MGVRDLKEHFGHEIDLEALRKVHVQMVVGSLDCKYVGESPCGSTIIERLKCLKQNFEAHGISVQLNVLDGVDHESLEGDEKRMAAFGEFFKKYM